MSSIMTTELQIEGSQYRDGTHRYWRDGHRWRWALVRRPDDGLGVRTHGAELTLEAAQAAAAEAEKQRGEAT